MTSPAARAATRRPPLARPRECVLGGVCAGLALHLGWPVVRVRWLFAGLSLCAGAGILLYLWLWALTPLEGAAPGEPEAVARHVPVARVLYIAAIASAGLLTVAASASWESAATLVFCVAVGCALAGVTWEEAVDARADGRPEPVWRLAAGAALVAVGLVGMTVVGARTGPLWMLAWLALVVAGLVTLAVPWAVMTWRALTAERTARVREEERAEIAAHLHDSVLQTLALIQNRAGASSEVARIARAQERELREWLYAGMSAPAADLGAQLREAAAELELAHPVRIEVVVVGRMPAVPALDQLAAAAREAMLNAAQHAGGDVSVYVEGSPSGIDVFVRDRGPGFQVDAVPADRLGVRESIIGRMRRAGGSASVRTRPGAAGTEVRLHLPASDDEGERA